MKIRYVQNYRYLVRGRGLPRTTISVAENKDLAVRTLDRCTGDPAPPFECYYRLL